MSNLLYHVDEVLRNKSLIKKDDDFEKFRTNTLSTLKKCEKDLQKLNRLLFDAYNQNPDKRLQTYKNIDKQLKNICNSFDKGGIEMITDRLLSLKH